MQVEYPKTLNAIHWDPLKVEYPVRKFPGTGVSSETIGHQWRNQPEIIKNLKEPKEEIKEYFRDYNITKQLQQSQTTLDYGFKHPETQRFNKHTSCTDNHYIYPPSRRLTDQPPQYTAHATTEMKSNYRIPTIPSRLVTDKNQFKHPRSYSDFPDIEPTWQTELEPLDTTHEGYEKYLDPYLTTNRLHHRPYTADQLNRATVTKDIITYYTFADVSWTRTPKPEPKHVRLPLSRCESTYDREKFKQGFREIRTHNTNNWISASFRTEVRDNYKPHQTPDSHNQTCEEEIRSNYMRHLTNLPPNIECEYSTVQEMYFTENSHYGSKKPLCAVIGQLVEPNKKLQRKGTRIRH